MNTHTPSPWDIDWDGVYLVVYEAVTRRNKDICTLSLDTGDEAANARLIAAAPDLLEALRGLDAIHPQSGNEPLLQALLEQARAVIDKATGGQP